MKKILTTIIALISLPFVVYAITITDEDINAFKDKAQWIALQKDEALIVPGVHSPLVKKTFKDQTPGMYMMPVFKKQISLGSNIKNAKLIICGLGHFEAFIDGRKVGNHFLDPAWSAYDKEAYYVSFDVTDMLTSKTQELRIALGNGFYNIPRKGYLKVLQSYGAPKVKALLRITYADGKIEDVVTDGSWLAQESPVIYSSIYCGETYDAKKESDDNWKQVLITTQSMELKAQQQAVTYHDTISHKRIISITEGTLLNTITETYDFGQNCSAIPLITIKGNTGDTIKMMPAELIWENGKVHNTVAPKYHFDYIISDSKEHTWQPQFSYTGWRYLQVTRPQNTTFDVKMVPVYADMTEVGNFNSSDTLLNKIHTLIDWAIKSNCQSVSTDCPTREKLGWLEQVYLMQESTMYRWDMSKLLRKAMDDMATAQHADGCIPTIAPEYIVFGDDFGDTPEWGSAFIQVPWKYYEWYGDISLIIKHYDRMTRYADYLTSKANSNIVAYGLGDWYDLGPKAPGFSQLTTNGVTATALYYSNVNLLSKMAALIGKREDSQKWSILASNIKKAYNDTFLHADSAYYDRNSQTANAISLCMDLVPDTLIDRVRESLANDIRKQGNTAGDIGYRYVLQALSEAGNDKLIYEIATTTKQPSYAYQLLKGATALTESWQALERVSNNHMMLGHLMQWLYGKVAGISQAEGSFGWNHIIINPCVLKSGDASLRIANGTIRCKYNITDKGYTYDVTIPEGSHATVVLPDKTVEMTSGRQVFTNIKPTFQFGTATNPEGVAVEVDSKGIIIGGKHVIPVMGEIHYSRIPESDWRREIRKMKAGGITVVATYVFWIHHEPVEGQWNWSGNRNLHRFMEICKEEGMPVVLRIGPFCHGEVYQGGFPEWVVRKAQEDSKNFKIRSEAKGFIAATERLYSNIFAQVNDQLWKNGGPIIGVQIENECRGPWSYYMRLKNIAVNTGFDTPFYTRTGWPKLNGKEEFGKMLPLYGDYADGFWDRTLNDMPGEYPKAFIMKDTRVSGVIATETFGTNQDTKMEKSDLQYPYLTCELGGGMMPSYHRRINISGNEAMPLAICKVGSGSNLPGYYMYHGGTNPYNPQHTMAECQATPVTNYNDMPHMSYDFQSPLGEMGQPNVTAFHQTRLLHQFLADWGEELSQYDVDSLSEHYARRGCFEFRNDYVRILNEGGTASVTPQGMKWNGLTISSSTIQPFAKADNMLYFIPVKNAKKFTVNIDGKKYALKQDKVLSIKEQSMVLLSNEVAKTAFVIDGKMHYSKHGGILYKDDNGYVTEEYWAESNLAPSITESKKAGPLREIKLGKQKVAEQPSEKDFHDAAVYLLDLGNINAEEAEDLFLEVNYKGDVARVYANEQLVEDNFWNGKPMLVRISDLFNNQGIISKKIELAILPLQKNAPIYLQKAQKDVLESASGNALLSLDGIRILKRTTK